MELKFCFQFRDIKICKKMLKKLSSFLLADLCNLTFLKREVMNVFRQFKMTGVV